MKKFTDKYIRYLPLALAFLIAASSSIAAIVGSLPYTLTNGTTADATQVMANYNKIISDVNANAAKNGVNSDISALTGLTTPLSAPQGGANTWYGGTSTGSANAQSVATLTPNNYALTAGNTATFIAGFTNTGATTLALNGTAATNVFKRTATGITALTGGEIAINTVVSVRYDGTQYQLMSETPVPFGAQTDLASAATTDLGTIVSHNVNVTGTTNISSFGSTAVTTYPLYKVTFAGALTLTYNATSMILPGAASISVAAGDTATAVYLGSGNWKVVDYMRNDMYPATGQLQGVQVFTANGTWTRPQGVRSAEIWCGGGGGGGASVAGGGGAGIAGPSGGAGGVSYIYTTSPASSYTITVPAAASGGASGAANAGSTGGTVTVGALLTCTGGLGGDPANGIVTGSNVNMFAGAAGGTGTGGTINLNGGQGQPGFGAGTSLSINGMGGSNILAAGGLSSTIQNGTSVAGQNGNTCGGGGSGGASNNAGGTKAGGNGGVGCVIVKSYY